MCVCVCVCVCACVSSYTTVYTQVQATFDAHEASLKVLSLLALLVQKSTNTDAAATGLLEHAHIA
jgi:hypothetical protein